MNYYDTPGRPYSGVGWPGQAMDHEMLWCCLPLWEELSSNAKNQYSQSSMRCSHCLPPGSLHALAVFDSLSQMHYSFKLIQNCLHGRFIKHIHSGQIYAYVFHILETVGARAILMKIYCGFTTELGCLYVYVYQRCPRTLAKICRKLIMYICKITMYTCILNYVYMQDKCVYI